MLRDNDFSSKARVDRYGRRLPKNAGRDELKRYYRVGDDEDLRSEEEAERSTDSEEKLHPLPLVGEAAVSSGNSSSEEDELDNLGEEEVFGLLNDQDGSIPKGEVSSRLAIVNLDWDNIRAVDLMAVFSSFAPTHGRIRKISIYPSKFGRERIEREELDGPPKDIFKIDQRDSVRQTGADDVDMKSEVKGKGGEGEELEDEMIKKAILKEDHGEEFNSARLRHYQLERLRYFYAILECSSPLVAEAIYNAVDGTEYLTTANFFDLRYVPDEVDFSEDVPRDECGRIPDGYRPNEFVTDALQHSRVRLTWDADDGSRKEAQKRAFAGSRVHIDENDLKAYIGGDSSECEEPQPTIFDATADVGEGSTPPTTQSEELEPKVSKKEAERQRTRSLLGLQAEPVSKKKLEKQVPVGDMQVTFSSGLSSDVYQTFVVENESERDQTTAEKYIRKEKERKARRKEKIRLSRNGTDPSANTLNEKPDLRNRSTNVDVNPQDLGFSDPFFTDPSRDRAKIKISQKDDKRKRQEERAGVEAAAAAKRAQLELIMMDDETTGEKSNHFNIKDIVKAGKASSMKNKSKKKLNEIEAEALKAEENDHFEVDVGDERFKEVFISSEFAIDPSHPRFKGTEGMKRLLQEGRKKRKTDMLEGIEQDTVVTPGKQKKIKAASDEGDVSQLVGRIRGKLGRI